ncbi:YlxR family protein [bacterium]|nr:MAG: YlxR family protein [bacterium]
MKHVPERTCCACGVKRPQSELRRVASLAGSAPTLDLRGKAPGRGAYLCFDVACIERALQRKALERALKLQNPLTEEFKTKLRAAQ